MVKLLLFDVDGTIAESSKKINAEILEQLKLLKNKYELGLVSGGTIEKIANQVGIENVISDDNPLFDYVFSENGMIGYKNGKNILYNNLSEIYNEERLSYIEKFIIDNTKSFQYDNDLVKLERRNTMWYFSPSGIYCNDEIRKDFMEKDEGNKLRIKIMYKLKLFLRNKFNLTVKLGGNIGLAIHPVGWDKSYLISNNIIDTKKYSEIYFFGDRCEPDGNDYSLYICPGVNGISVKNPNETLKLLKNIS